MTRLIISLVLPFFLLMIVPPQAGAATSKSAIKVQPEKNVVISSDSLDALAEAVGVIDAEAGKRHLKIAILDNGFQGFKTARGQTLPKSTRLRGHVARMPEPEEGHGLKMAEIVSNLLDRTGASYDLHLFPAWGYKNFANAVDTAVAEKFDLILYSQVWELAGNDDGHGFINEIVNRATSRGIIWVNAAGNFGRNLYRTTLERASDNWAKLPGPYNSVRIRCSAKPKDDGGSGTCKLRLALAWNDFSDDVEAGTEKDLDLVLFDNALNVVAKSETKQTRELINEGDSIAPYELIQTEIKPGLYYARVKIRSNNFSDQDSFRITTSGDLIEMKDITTGASLMAPADNPSVIAVGASDTNKSSFSLGRDKPLRTKSLIDIDTDANEKEAHFKGSSQASAAFAARIAYELTLRKDLDRDSVLQIVRGGTPRPIPPTTRAESDPYAEPAAIVKIAPPRSCYPYSPQFVRGKHILAMLADGGVVVKTTTGIKIFIDENPFDRVERLGLSISSKDLKSNSLILVADSTGLFSTDTSNRAQLGSGMVEIAQTPKGAVYCSLR